MDFSKLSANERMAAWAAVVVVVAGVIANIMSYWGGLFWVAVVAAVLVLAVVFQPQFMPSTRLPGSKGSLLVLLGVVGAAGAVIQSLQWLNYIVNHFTDIDEILYLVAVVASVVVAWAGWNEFQAEGGKFQLGTGGAGAGPAAPPPAAPPAAPPPAAPPPAAPMMDEGHDAGGAMGGEMEHHSGDEGDDLSAM